MCKQPAAAPFPLRVGYMYATCLLGVRPSLPRAFNSSSRHSNIEVWVCVPNRNRMATHEFRIRIDSSELTIDRGVAVHLYRLQIEIRSPVKVLAAAVRAAVRSSFAFAEKSNRLTVCQNAQ